MVKIIVLKLLKMGNFLQKCWCVAKPSSDQATLLANINFACSQVDCRVMQKGCPCFSPDNLISHASIVMNLYYQSKGRNKWNCDFRGSGLIVITNPSKWISFMFLWLIAVIYSLIYMLDVLKFVLFLVFVQVMLTAFMTSLSLWLDTVWFKQLYIL